MRAPGWFFGLGFTIASMGGAGAATGCAADPAGSDLTEAPAVGDEPDPRSGSGPAPSTEPSATDAPIEEPEEEDSPKLEGATTIYVAAEGDDANDGTEARPFATLQKANDHLVASFGANGQRLTAPVEVRIAPGRYVGQFTLWKFSHPTLTTKIAGHAAAGSQGAKPSFVGCNAARAACADNRAWLRIGLPVGRATNLVIENVKVSSYFKAVHLSGDPDDLTAWNGSNVITRCAFSNIGSKYAGDTWSPAVLTVRNSRSNRITNNTFENIANARAFENRWLHTTYLSHGASDNLVKGNRLTNVAADFHLRNRSDRNRFEDNVVTSSFTTALVTEWEDVGEAGSCDTVIARNTWNGNFYCERYTALYEDNAGDRRCAKKFSASGNRFGAVAAGCRSGQ